MMGACVFGLESGRILQWKDGGVGQSHCEMPTAKPARKVSEMQGNDVLCLLFVYIVVDKVTVLILCLAYSSVKSYVLYQYGIPIHILNLHIKVLVYHTIA